MKNLLLLALVLCSLSACDKKISDSSAKSGNMPETLSSNPATLTEVTQSTVQPNTENKSVSSDLSRIEQVAVSTQGTGQTLGAAINEALMTAVMQVNGVTIDAANASLKVVAHAVSKVEGESPQEHEKSRSINSNIYANAIISQSHGVISSFQIEHIEPPTGKDRLYSVAINVKVAKFSAPAATSNKPKIVVAPIHTRGGSFDIGGHPVLASKVGRDLHRKIVESLTQTGRFIVLDRESTAEINHELDLVASGQSVNTDVAKLGQALSADLIWVGEINTLAYTRHVRQLRSSDRQLVSYSGNWTFSQRTLNVATRQIQQSSTLHGKAPSVAPTTMSHGINTTQTLENIETDIVKKTTATILLRTFPIEIVQRTGDQVVLNQGSGVLKPKTRYRGYLVPRKAKDAAIGNFRSKTKVPCCEVVINRVTPSLSYATLENIQIPLNDISDSSLQLREAVAADVSQAANALAASLNSQPHRHTEHHAPKEASTASSLRQERDDW